MGTTLILTDKIIKRIEVINRKKKKENFFDEYFSACVLENLHAKERDPILLLRHEGRLHKDFYNVPSDILTGAIRGSDDNGEDCTIERKVTVNHNADLIFHPKDKEKINELLPNNNSFIDIYYGKNGRYKRRTKDFYYTPFTVNYKGFLAGNIGVF